LARTGLSSIGTLRIDALEVLDDLVVGIVAVVEVLLLGHEVREFVAAAMHVL
jgi:hypothetical protein